VAHRRLDPQLRPRWDRWAAAIIKALGARPGPEEPDRAFRAHLTQLTARPLPPAQRRESFGFKPRAAYGLTPTSA